MEKASRIRNLVWLGFQWVLLVNPSFFFPNLQVSIISGLSNLLGEVTQREL